MPDADRPHISRTRTLRYGVIGFGYWGPNIARPINQSERSRLAAIAEQDPKRRALAERDYPFARIAVDAQELIDDPELDVIAIATPISTHYPLAMAALRAGKHLFIEKPMATSSRECEELLAEAGRRKRIIFVDHTFVYTGAIRKIRQLIRAGELGRIMYYDSVRINLGLIQRDSNVIWDLIVHDLAILDYIMPDKPRAVMALGARPIAGQPESIAYMTLFYPDEVIAHVHASWLAPVKVRQTLIGGDRRMIVYNDLEPSEKIKIYDRGVDTGYGPEAYGMRIGYRSGDMVAPQVDLTEALRTAIEDANASIIEGRPPTTDGAVGHRIVSILEAADASMRAQARIIPLP
jgi:predicted dehydrogenase